MHSRFLGLMLMAVFLEYTLEVGYTYGEHLWVFTTDSSVILQLSHRFFFFWNLFLVPCFFQKISVLSCTLAKFWKCPIFLQNLTKIKYFSSGTIENLIQMKSCQTQVLHKKSWKIPKKFQNNWKTLTKSFSHHKKF